MPITARMSLWGLYKYDNTILDNLTVPAGMDADNLKQNLLVETSSLSVLYPDPDFMKTVIGLWAAERADVWNKLYETTQLQYNPIENYDRMEESEEQNSDLSVSDTSGSSSTTSSQNRQMSQSDNASRSNDSSQDKHTSQSDASSHSGSSVATNANTAYNSNAFADTAKTESSGSDKTDSISTGKENTSSSGSEKTSSVMTGRDDQSGSTSDTSSARGSVSSNGRRKLVSRVHGNIGVTTSQQMIEAQREVAEFCMTEYIINDFIQRFCVMVY